MQIRFLPSLFLSLSGLVLAVGAYAAPFGNTGVDGSIGALLALIGATFTAAGAGFLLLKTPPLRSTSVLRGVLVLAAVLTAVAGYFLMQFLLAVLMAAAAVAFLLAPFLPSSRSPA